MKSRFLFPHPLKTVGWILLFPSLLLGLAVLIFDFEWSILTVKVYNFWPDNGPLRSESNGHWLKDNLTSELAGVLVTFTTLFLGFSKEKEEDEYIQQLRLDSLLWAVYVSAIFMLISFLCVFGMSFILAMCINMFTTLLFHMLRYNFLLFKLKLTNREK